MSLPFSELVLASSVVSAHMTIEYRHSRRLPGSFHMIQVSLTAPAQSELQIEVQTNNYGTKYFEQRYRVINEFAAMLFTQISWTEEKY